MNLSNMWKPSPRKILTSPSPARRFNLGDPSPFARFSPHLVLRSSSTTTNIRAYSVCFDYLLGVEYVLGMKNAGQRILCGVKRCEEGEKPRTFIREPDGKKAMCYIPIQRRLNPNYILQPECVVQHQLFGHLSVFLEEELLNFRDATCQSWTISKLHDTIKGLNLCLQHLCREGLSHGKLEDGIFFSKGKVLLHGVSSRSNFIDRDMETFHNIVTLFASVMNTKNATVEEQGMRASIKIYLRFLNDFRDKNKVKIKAPNYRVRERPELNWPLLLLIHPTFWDENRATATRVVRNLESMLRRAPESEESLSTSDVFEKEIGEKFKAWESALSPNCVAVSVKNHMYYNREVTKRHAHDVIAFCDNFIKHHAEQSRNNCLPVKGMPEVIEELLMLFPNYFEVMYEAYLKAFSSLNYTRIKPERLFYEEGLMRRSHGNASSQAVTRAVQMWKAGRIAQGKAWKQIPLLQQRLSLSDIIDDPSSLMFPDDFSNSVIGANLRVFSLAELRVVTSNFSWSNLLGEGGFGPLFKGFVDGKLRLGLKAQPVAVKLLDLDGLQGHREWLAELVFLGQLRHPNLVKLIGYCCEEEHRLLVYEFMPRGSLENQLFRSYSTPLSWWTRMKIAVGAAKGLAFLHEADNKPVIFRLNILLDSGSIQRIFLLLAQL